ncbi:aspartic proteinase-like protein 2 [Selaginella moellendorffii]|nr:aspartic proteinase-like protein 2 [Selaginella moellendorffii]|eukprot:XP_002971323.2 aspartic proteinase-like protein 2 [Selaginella moellendorffii]
MELRSSGCPGLWTRILVLCSLLAIVCGEAPAGAGILRLTHRYSDREGSSRERDGGGGGMSKEHFQLLLDHDRGRRGRFLAEGVDFSLGGTADPLSGGLYFTQVGLGNPVKHYIVQVDTGSDVLWVNCRPCSGCPRKSALNIPLTMYDPRESSTTSLVSCSDPLCVRGRRFAEAQCSQTTNNCEYIFSYGDGSTSEGYYVRDAMQYNVISSNGLANTTSQVLFGCSIRQTGDLSTSQQAVDGIIGFGQLELSVPNQLAAQQNIPRVFSHCLEGEKRGGGILVIGGIAEPGMTYTPLVPDSVHYNVVLRGISVNSNRLPIDAEDFSSTNDTGVIMDSGTTLAYFPSGAYNVFVQAIREATSATPVRVQGMDTQCFLVSGRLSDLFPNVTLNFEGGAMELQPDNYLMWGGTAPTGTTDVWCIGWQSSSSSAGPKDGSQLTILGDIVLKDKLVVYDLDNSRIGWMSYNCSDEVKVAGHAVIASHLDSNAAISTKPSRVVIFLLVFILSVCIH